MTADDLATAPTRLQRVGRCLSGDDGVSLVEILVAFTILAVTMTAVASALTQGLGITRTNELRVVAANLVTQRIEVLRAGDFAAIPIGLAEEPVSIDGQPFTVTSEAQWIPVSADFSACDAPATGAGAPAYLNVRVRATWEGAVRPVESQTVISPPVSQFNPTLGNISVKLSDRLGARLSSTGVTVSGPSGSRSIITDFEGCAFFAGLTPGAYTIRLNRPGYVERTQRRVDPTINVVVTAATTTKSEIAYDRAATLVLAPASPLGGTVPGAVRITMTTPEDAATIPVGTTAFPRTVTPLFPYTGGYEAYAGACAAASPTVNGGSGLQRFASDPGGTTTAVIALNTLRVTLTTADGVTPRTGQTITAQMVNGACTETLVLGNTNAAGQVTAALPFGTWRIYNGTATANIPLTVQATPSVRTVAISR